MKALLLKEKNVLSLEDAPAPKPSENEELLMVSYCSICRADSKMWEYGHRDLVLPRILGHEISGVSKKTGERFVVWPGLSCGTCGQCASGAENLCDKMKIIGFHKDGGFAEFVSVPKESLVPIPDSLPLKLASLAEPLACGINALEQVSELNKNVNALICGGGSVGLMTAFAFASHGIAANVLEKSLEKIHKSKDFIKKTNIAIEQEFDNIFDVAINAVSSNGAFSNAIAKLSKGGSLIFFSGLSESLPAKTINEIHYKQLKISGAYGCTKKQMQKAVKILGENQEAFKHLIEKEVNLEDVPEILPLVESGEHFKFTIALQPPSSKHLSR